MRHCQIYAGPESSAIIQSRVNKFRFFARFDGVQCNIFRGDSCTNGSSIRRPTDEKRRKKQNRVREFIGLRGASSRLMLFTFICFFRSETAEDQEKKRGKNCPLVNDLTHFGYLRRSFSQIKKCMNRAARTHTKAKAARLRN